MSDLRIECHRQLMKFSWKVIRLSRQNLSDLGFAWNQYSVMKSIQPGESVTLSEISTRAFKENSNVTALVDFLEEKGIVSRVNDKNDRRIVRVELTEAGIGIREKAVSEHEEFMKRLFKDVEDEEMKQFIDILNVFNERMF